MRADALSLSMTDLESKTLIFHGRPTMSLAGNIRGPVAMRQIGPRMHVTGHIAPATPLPKKFGVVRRASIYRAGVYLLGAPVYLAHVLLKNWQSYVEGRATKRIAFAACVLDGSCEARIPAP